MGAAAGALLVGGAAVVAVSPGGREGLAPDPAFAEALRTACRDAWRARVLDSALVVLRGSDLGTHPFKVDLLVASEPGPGPGTMRALEQSEALGAILYTLRETFDEVDAAGTPLRARSLLCQLIGLPGADVDPAAIRIDGRTLAEARADAPPVRFHHVGAPKTAPGDL